MIKNPKIVENAEFNELRQNTINIAALMNVTLDMLNPFDIEKSRISPDTYSTIKLCMESLKPPTGVVQIENPERDHYLLRLLGDSENSFGVFFSNYLAKANEYLDTNTFIYFNVNKLDSDVLGYSSDADSVRNPLHSFSSNNFPNFPVQNVDYALFKEKQKEISQRVVDYIHTFNAETIVKNYYKKFNPISVVSYSYELEPATSLNDKIDKLSFTAAEKEEITGLGLGFDFVGWENRVKELKDKFIEAYGILKKTIDEFNGIILELKSDWLEKKQKLLSKTILYRFINITSKICAEVKAGEVSIFNPSNSQTLLRLPPGRGQEEREIFKKWKELLGEAGKDIIPYKIEPIQKSAFICPRLCTFDNARNELIIIDQDPTNPLLDVLRIFHYNSPAKIRYLEKIFNEQCKIDMDRDKEIINQLRISRYPELHKPFPLTDFRPDCICFDTNENRLFLTDYNRKIVRVIDKKSMTFRDFGSDILKNPSGIALTDKYIIVYDNTPTTTQIDKEWNPNTNSYIPRYKSSSNLVFFNLNDLRYKKVIKLEKQNGEPGQIRFVPGEMSSKPILIVTNSRHTYNGYVRDLYSQANSYDTNLYMVVFNNNIDFNIYHTQSHYPGVNYYFPPITYNHVRLNNIAQPIFIHDFIFDQTGKLIVCDYFQKTMFTYEFKLKETSSEKTAHFDALVHFEVGSNLTTFIETPFLKLKTSVFGLIETDYCGDLDGHFNNNNSYRSLCVDNNNNIIVCDRSGLYIFNNTTQLLDNTIEQPEFKELVDKLTEIKIKPISGYPECPSK